MRYALLSSVTMMAAFALAQGNPAYASESDGAAITEAGLLVVQPLSLAKAASAQTIASRGFVSSSNTAYGGFQITNAADIYILVRGNSLGSLGITNGFLDAPRVRLYNQAGQDIIVNASDSRPGFSGCVTSDPLKLPVVNYYATRGVVQARDTCIGLRLAAGVYTFSVTPSLPGVTTTSTSSQPSAGEILFEVTLGP